MNSGGDCPRFLDSPHDLRISSAAFSKGTYHQLAGAHAARQQSIMPHGVEHYHALQGRFLWDFPWTRWELGGNSVDASDLWVIKIYTDELLISRIEKHLWTFYDILHHFAIASSFILGETGQFFVYQRGADPCLISEMCKPPLGYEIMELICKSVCCCQNCEQTIPLRLF